mmetsp:Transcript_30267/g.28920  ORF Transcript_30267/g.28920 Transcript_30267/m.28920 type:complete len:200 (+) Transcript_30267:141-740(+)
MTKNEDLKLINVESQNLSYNTTSLESTKIDIKVTVKLKQPQKDTKIIMCLDFLNPWQRPSIGTADRPFRKIVAEGSPNENNDRAAQSLLSDMSNDLIPRRSENTAEIRGETEWIVAKRVFNGRGHEEEVVREDNEETYGALVSCNSLEDSLINRSEGAIEENNNSFHTFFYGKLNQAHNEGLAISANRNAAILKQQWVP